MERSIDIGNGVHLGGGAPCVVLLDAGVNHNNDMDRAIALIDTAAAGGASAIKFQTYTAEEISTKTAPRYWDPKLDTDGGGSQYDMFKKVDHLPKSAYAEMKAHAAGLGIAFSSSPFGMESARFLISLDVDFFKIASAELIYHDMIRVCAETGKPLIMSTGTATIGEIEEAIQVCLDAGNDRIALQHCILSYPCRDEDANLARMLKMKQFWPELPVGYSDHTLGTRIPLAAVAMGAVSIEKHYTVDKSLPDSPDHGLSLSADELPGFMDDVRAVESAIGVYANGHYPAEEKAWLYARKSLTAAVDICAGEVITADKLAVKRPGTGIYARHADVVVGRTAKADIPADTTITWDMV
ncbi:MAG: N-acetylneuraminate synthase [Actinobacteria bacterium]|nr:MAG: N-acetylneuraminate synthase [Actinomycetota bacterium]